MRFTLHETPQPKDREGKAPRHARVVHDETVSMEKMCKLISASSSFSSADVKGILEAFQLWMGVYMAGGSIIQLDGLGHFYPVLKSRTYVDEDGKEGLRIRVDTVGFKCAPKLKKSVREAELEEEKRRQPKRFASEERLARILDCLASDKYMSSYQVERLNNCSKYIALQDLETLRSEGKIERIGRTRQTLYVLPFAR